MSNDITEDDMFSGEMAAPYAGSDRGPKSPTGNRALAARRQALVMAFLESSGPAGATAKETVTYLQANGETNAHHGNASGALSAMHKDGRISRLASKRDRYYVYVLNEHVNGRETQPHGSSTKKGDEVLGLGRKTAVVEDTAAHEEIARLRDEVARMTAQRDEANRLYDEQCDRLATAQTRNDEFLDTLGQRDEQLRRVEADLEAAVRREKEYQEAADRIISGLQHNLTVANEREEQARTALEAAQAASARPRKTITADERDLLGKVAGVVAKKSDGTKDKPETLYMKVSTLRTLINALARVTSDN